MTETAVQAEPRRKDGVSFSSALVMLKDGYRITRDGWNGKGMWLYYVAGGHYKSQMKAAADHFGDTVPYRPYIAMLTAQGDVVPWVASQSDLLAHDWLVLE